MILEKSLGLLFFLFSVGVAHAAISKDVESTTIQPNIPKQSNLIDLRTHTTSEEERKIIQRNMGVLIEAFRTEDMQLISYISKKEMTHILLYGRDQGGGNLFHYLAQNQSLNPEFIQKVFIGEYREYKKKPVYAEPSDKYYTVREQVSGGLIEVSPKFIGKALKSRNENGFTPKELAIQNKNKPILEVFYQIENDYNSHNDNLSVLSAAIGIAGTGFGSIAHLIADSPTLEAASGGAVLVGLASLCRTAYLQTQKINNKPSLQIKD